MVQLMREYLDAEQPGAGAVSTALSPVTESVIDELSSIAAVRGDSVAAGGHLYCDDACAGVSAAARFAVFDCAL